MSRKIEAIFLVVLLALGAFFAFYKLTESPPTWMDEGLITQTSRNLATQGHYALQVAPGEFVSPGFITTSYPVTLPIALSYKIWGVGLSQARLVMAFYILAFFALAYFLMRKHYGARQALLSLALLVTFTPIYGHGKNVLGEVPGLVWLLAGLLFFDRWWAGFLFGLAVVTKPIFILLLPGLVLAPFLRSNLEGPRVRPLGLAFWLALVIPVLLWLPIQFPHNSLLNILSIYANPHHTDLVSSIFVNSRRFLTEAQAFYALALLLFWLISLFRRSRRKIQINKPELVALVFSVLVYLAYLRTIGYYRYFFLGEVLALMYLPVAALSLLRSKLEWYPKVRHLIATVFVLLSFFQLYQTTYHSWVAQAYGSHRTHDLATALSQIPPDKLVFVYQAPELVNFLPSNDYLQYVKVTQDIIVGQQNISKLNQGLPKLVLAHATDANLPVFNLYPKRQSVDQYLIMSEQ